MSTPSESPEEPAQQEPAQQEPAQQQQQQQELVDVVDDDDRVVATVTRAEMRARRLLHRCVSIAVVGSDGRLLVHRRADTKDVWPGRWDIAAGGVVSSGEDDLSAARRELAEELGVDLPAEHFEELGRGRYVDDDVAVIARCFRVVHDGPFEFTDGEIAEVRWVDLGQFEAMRRERSFVPDSIALLLPSLRPLLGEI